MLAPLFSIFISLTCGISSLFTLSFPFQITFDLESGSSLPSAEGLDVVIKISVDIDRSLPLPPYEFCFRRPFCAAPCLRIARNDL